MYKSSMKIRFTGEERYKLDLVGDTWALYRHTVGDLVSYLIEESNDINDIFLAMFKDKASRGRGSKVRIG
jgi:hypothetical protein